MIPPTLLSPRLRRAALALALAIHSAASLAGEFFEWNGAAIRGFDPVAYFTEGKPVRGSPDYQATYKGSTFHFRSQANRDAFAAAPTRYAPQYGGFCAFGTAGGYKAATEPSAFTIVGDKLYLNYNEDVRKRWSGDIPGYVTRADRKWPDVSRQTKVVE